MLKKIFHASKIIIRLVLLVCIAIGSIWYVSEAVRVKKLEKPNDTTNKVHGFYALEDDTLDVLFLGTSHAYYAFNPGLFYEKTNLNSYVFAGECQPMAVSYYYLIEALKTQSPNVVVLDLFSLMPSSQGCQTEGIIQKNLEDFKFSKNKMEALNLIQDEEARNDAKFDLMLYRQRWSELSKEDWLYPLSSHFNYEFGLTQGWPDNVGIFNRPEYLSEERLAPIDEQLEYVEEILDICNENDIEVIFFKTPYYVSEEDHDTLNYLQDYAELKGIPFIDMNEDYKKYGFLFDRDGDVWHCNLKGSTKVTNVISDLINTYGLTSVNPNVYKEEYYNLYYQTLTTVLYQQYGLKELESINSYVDLTWVFVYGKQDYTIIKDEYQKSLEKLGFSHNIKEKVNENYYSIVKNGMKLSDGSYEGKLYYETAVDNHWIIVNTDNEKPINVDGTDYGKTSEGINILLIDNLTGEVLYCFGINTKDYFVFVY